jgi:hypothetical protein
MQRGSALDCCIHSSLTFTLLQFGEKSSQLEVYRSVNMMVIVSAASGVLSFGDWQIVTDISMECTAFIVSV